MISKISMLSRANEKLAFTMALFWQSFDVVAKSSQLGPSIFHHNAMAGHSGLTRIRTLLPLTSTSVMESLLERDILAGYWRVKRK